MDIKNIIGDYEFFFSDLLYRLKGMNIDVAGIPISHFSFRTETDSEYQKMLSELKIFCKEFSDIQFNGRAVSVLILKDPLVLRDGFDVSVLELLAPRSVHMYTSGLESIGLILGKKLPEFNGKHRSELTGTKDHGIYCQPSFITFDNNKTAKFYDISLKEIVELDGWKFEKLY